MVGCSTRCGASVVWLPNWAQQLSSREETQRARKPADTGLAAERQIRRAESPLLLNRKSLFSGTDGARDGGCAVARCDDCDRVARFSRFAPRLIAAAANVKPPPTPKPPPSPASVAAAASPCA